MSGHKSIPISSVYLSSKEKGIDGQTPYLEIGNVDIKTKKYSTTDKNSVKGCRIAQADDVLVSRVRPTRGAVTYIKEKSIFVSSAFTVLRNIGMTNKYLFYFLIENTDFFAYLGNNCTGTMYPTVSEETILNYKIPLIPLNEQKRIITKLDAIMPRIEAVKERLEKVPVIIDKFRKSVLYHAFSGDLSKNWREVKNLPEWSVIELEKIAEIIDPNPSHRYPSYENGRVPILATEQFVGLNDWDVTTAKLVNYTFYQERKGKHGFLDDDIIFARKGRLGLPRKAPKMDEYVFSHTVFIIRSLSNMNSNFLLWALRDYGVVPWLLDEMNSNTGVPTLGKAIFSKLQIPFPSLEEQEYIACEVERFFMLADKIEAHYQQAKTRVDKLSQSVLAKAFRGDLVPQDPNDEPAEKLLELILEEKAKMEAELKVMKSAAKKKVKKIKNGSKK